MTISTEATYDADLAAASEIVASRSDMTSEQTADAISDTLNNTWFDGIEVSVWANQAAAIVNG